MTTTTLHDFTLSPDIIVGREEHRRLTVLALGGTGHSPEEADSLLYELQRALIVPDAFVPPDAVRMGSRVRYRDSDGAEHEAVLAYPGEAGPGRVSVIAPVGTALIGLRRGQSITCTATDGGRKVLTALAVWPPASGEDDDPGPSAA